MKTKFKLDVLSSPINAVALIIGTAPKDKVYVKIENITDRINKESFDACIKDKDLELFAVNILKALKSKKLA